VKTDAVDAHAEIGVRNSQPEGIGRVVALEQTIAWNNLGRNIVFADHALRPRCIFGTTTFPDDDELSQYDLDIHAILELPRSDLVLALNHLGSLRAFRGSELARPGPIRVIEPVTTMSFVADVERTVIAAGRLIGSGPRSEGGVGVLISEPVTDARDGVALEVDLCAQHFGEVTALGVIEQTGEDLVALGGDGHVALLAGGGGDLRHPRWEVAVPFRVATCAWDGTLLWVTGSERPAGPVDDYDWDSVHGGGFAGLDRSDGRTVVAGPLPDAIAWGTGGTPVAPCGHGLAAVGRDGRVHVLDTRRGEWRSTAPLTSTSLGMAHAAAIDDRVLFGLNRGGYRLHATVTADRA
jgi:hypothetical protein